MSGTHFDSPDNPMLKTEARRVEPTNPFVEFPRDEIEHTIPGRFEGIVRSFPARRAVKSAQGEWTYGQLNRAANSLAHAIVTDCGIDPEPIVLLIQNRVSVIVAMFAALKANKFYAPLETDLPDARLTSILEDLGAPMVVTDSANASRVRGLTNGTVRVLSVETLDGRSSTDDLGLSIPADAISSILYTSGSTGKPKGVVRDHRSVLHGVWWQTNRLHQSQSDCTLLFESPTFSAAAARIFGALLNGGSIVVANVREEGLGNLVSMIEREGITNFHLMPSLYRHIIALLDVSQAPYFPNVRLLSLTGETILRQDVEAYQRFFSDDCLLRVSLASTETQAFTLNLMDKSTALTSNIVPVGYPVDDYEVRLVDDRGASVGFDMPGEILVSSPFIARGYWRDTEQTDRAFAVLPSGVREYRTGDMGRMRQDGMLEHSGRKDFQVKIRGFRVETNEIQVALCEHPKVLEAAIVLRENGAGDKSIVAYVVPMAGEILVPNAMRAYLRTKLPDYMIPSRFVTLERLPLTQWGKLDRSALPEPSDTGSTEHMAWAAPTDETSAWLVNLWQTVLGVTPIGVNDDFFSLGGESLHAARIAAEIQNKYGRTISPTVFVEAPTIKLLSRLVQGDWRVEEESLIVPLQPNGKKAPLFLLHGFGGGVIDYAPMARLLDPDRPVFGVLAATKDAAPDFETMVARSVREVRAVRPRGPYYLGGYSYGGAVAFEIAQQLMAAGEEVGLLAMLDYTAPVRGSRPWRFNRGYMLDLARNFPRWAAEFLGLGPRGMALRVQRKARRLIRRLAGDKSISYDPSEIVDEIRNVDTEKRAFMEYESRLLRAYRPRLYPGRVTVIRACARPLFGPFDPELGWKELARGGVVSYETAGSHNSLLKESNAPMLAEQLCKSLAET